MIFGTDGIRGIVDRELNPEFAYKIGKAIGIYIKNYNLSKCVIIGKDTRLSGDTYASAIASGLTNLGIDVIISGIISTPAISFLCGKLDVGAGIMITASHNDNKYNGIKCFTFTGEKFDKSLENEIENNINKKIISVKSKGHIYYRPELIEIYNDFLKSECNVDLKGLTVVVDCANGANYSIAPSILQLMGANVIKISCLNDGKNINKNCGANNTKKLVKEVLLHSADYGISFDGDGDRLAFVLSNGRSLSGDELLYIFSRYLNSINKLNGQTVVGTIMSNTGLEKMLNKLNIKFIRTEVGDKNIINVLKDKHLPLGGEASGHICFFEHNRSCDALFNALYLLKIIQSTNIDIEKLLLELQIYPSITKNISIKNEYRKNYDNLIELHNAIQKISKENSDCNIIVRPSGTESVIRLYVESISENRNNIVLNELLSVFDDYKKKND